eukprot:560952-Rhodomonas_salina.1
MGMCKSRLCNVDPSGKRGCGVRECLVGSERTETRCAQPQARVRLQKHDTRLTSALVSRDPSRLYAPVPPLATA